MPVDPTQFSSSRCKFLFPNSKGNAFLPDVMLLDFGITSPRLDPALSHNYNALSGALTAGARITLLAGDTVLDCCEDTSVYTPTVALQCTNAHSQDINRKELLSGMGFSVTAEGSYTLESKHVDWHGQNVAAQRHLDQFNIPTTDSGASGLIHLSDYLPILKSMGLEFMPDLRLEIEWNVNADDYHADGAGVITPTPIRPTLLVQKVIGAVPPKGERKLTYLRNVMEKLVIPAVALDVTHEVTLRSGAFNNKIVKDLVFVNQPSAQGAFTLWPRKERSVAQRNEKLQVVVNSSPILPGEGIIGGAQKAQYFIDTMSPLNMLYLAACTDAIHDTNDNMLEADIEEIVGNYSIICVPVDNLVQTMQYKFSRTGGAAAHQREAINLVVIGRVMTTVLIDRLDNVTIRD